MCENLHCVPINTLYLPPLKSRFCVPWRVLNVSWVHAGLKFRTRPWQNGRRKTARDHEQRDRQHGDDGEDADGNGRQGVEAIMCRRVVVQEHESVRSLRLFLKTTKNKNKQSTLPMRTATAANLLLSVAMDCGPARNELVAGAQRAGKCCTASDLDCVLRSSLFSAADTASELARKPGDFQCRFRLA